MNAICHRDLYEEGATVMVEVYDDRVEISNPGGLLPVVAEKFGEKSMSRNPLILGLFTRMHLVEKVGSGFPRMRRLMKEAGLPEPIFDTRGFFTVTFMKRVKENNGSSNEPINEPLNGTLNGQNDTINDTIKGHEAMIIELLKDKTGLSGVQIAENLNLSLSTVMRATKRLVSQSLIEYRGSKKTGGYYIKDKQK